MIGDDAHLGQHAGVLQVTVGDGAFEVVDAYQLSLHFLREGNSPHVGLAGVVIIDSTHAGLGGIRRSNVGGVLRHYFGQVSGARAETGSEPGEGVEMIFERPGYLDASIGGLVEREL